ncbi:MULTISPECIES: precorrin-6y C5,15-methyltransferase (decarboxylating) subunit CbiE [unclassified Ruegeria]|uniref:precorrin-6y C5,15-methyltransferase (decarboxylating) subunit CbiE n=1 Tax=unclassified Ruegeria TaxID=2625375 RepID=UPI00149152E7|nr:MULTISPECIES: precorrin-6y C5,15-methyltransferase (decarboxylating) subunit CbiE [unclassified Ruegeria]NOD87917.1 precorrin-6y C5,15-methyltransferase (decarboxylating) subunit CbiE [Ruegeria sp. HKCCD4318]NOE14287.1 precorrin-6y C5,15-methyltransferase (decarboxylating) subunit CbiE [Ruegeria sp. HKCCD4318-2]NOG08356.1 precorrin-6y C5,15-methyltransferase (decarboxylating) subunit CbiE [Ruegeria sp. HKCCD4315]
MSDAPWLTVLGLGEDGLDGLSPTSRQVLDRAEVIMGPPRHLSLLPETGAERIEWPVPFSDGLPILQGLRGKQTVVLASGDPFWFGAGSVIARNFDAGEWTALPGQSTFSLAAARLGWPLESTLTFGLHAAPLTRLRPHLAPGLRAILLLRDGKAVAELATYLTETGFADSSLHVMQALGGPRENSQTVTLTEALPGTFDHPVCVGLDVTGAGPALSKASGKPDDIFETDGQITKRPIRALTLSALAPQRGEHLWDIGGGTGSISIEWLMCDPTLSATCIEPRADRAERIRRNADTLGQDRLNVVHGTAPKALSGVDLPDVVFIGGGLSANLLAWLRDALPKGTRLVANAVTLESEALLARWHEDLGGDLLRIELAHSAPLGQRRGWKSAYPVVQWSVTL